MATSKESNTLKLIEYLPRSKADIEGGSAMNSNSGGGSFGTGASSFFFVTNCSSSDCFLATESATLSTLTAGLSSGLPSLKIQIGNKNQIKTKPFEML